MKTIIKKLALSMLTVLMFTQCTKANPETSGFDVTLSQQSIQVSTLNPATVTYSATSNDNVTVTILETDTGLAVVNRFDTVTGEGSLIISTTSVNRDERLVNLIFNNGKYNRQVPITVTTKSEWAFVPVDPVEDNTGCN